jgi:hypothetical protein
LEKIYDATGHAIPVFNNAISLVSENSNEFPVCSGDSFLYFVLRWHAQ